MLTVDEIDIARMYQAGYNRHVYRSRVRYRYTAANPSKEGEAMMEVLTLFLVVFAAMSFVVAFITLNVIIIKAMKSKK